MNADSCRSTDVAQISSSAHDECVERTSSARKSISRSLGVVTDRESHDTSAALASMGCRSTPGSAGKARESLTRAQGTPGNGRRAEKTKSGRHTWYCRGRNIGLRFARALGGLLSLCLSASLPCAHNLSCATSWWEALDRVRHAGHAGHSERSRDPKMTTVARNFH
eukprot:2853062-Prymnesium_polylepis.1